MSGSQIFRRNRCLGYVSNTVPSVTRFFAKRKDNLIVTCIGRAFQIYTASHFRLLRVSAIHPDDITCLAIDKCFIYAASNKWIYAWRGGAHVKYIYKGHTEDVRFMVPFRDYLIAIDDANVLRVWNIRTGDVYIEIPFKASEFRITAVVHPPTYLNKILLGSEQGSLQLWNIKDHRLIHTFPSYNSKINVLEAAPALDVAAIGYNDGRIVLLNLKYDEIVMEFNQDWGPVTGITFRTDGISYLATSSTNGNVVFWDLDDRKVASQIVAHTDAVTTLICLPNEPLLLTSSPDNSMKLWIFDKTDGGARLLRERGGHSAPPLCIRYHGSNGENILSSGEDSSLRIFSTLSETLNKSLGRASYNRKASRKKKLIEYDPLIMPPIVHFTSETTRDKEWDSIAAIHTGLVEATTWSYDKKKMGEWKLVPGQFQNKNKTDFNVEATCLILTYCGNFVIIGYSSGDVERFNVQSGIHRTKYGNPAHDSAIRGVACDSLSQMVITGGSDGYVKFWNFKESTTTEIARLNMHNGIRFFRSHRESALICVALENFVVYVVDSDTKIVVRKFKGHTAPINDATFSPDSRWLITAAMDSTIKVWDIPSSYMIDHFKVERPCVSLTMSPTGDFLATAHVNYLGIFLWANKMLFSQISLRSVNPFSEAPSLDLPATVEENVTAVEDSLEDLTLNAGERLEMNYETPLQLDSKLITMSGLAASRWQNLLDLDIIKKRNKPRAPPKVPKQAPFFLPTVAGPELKFDLSGAQIDQDDSRIIVPQSFVNLTAFAKLLHAAIGTNDNKSAIAHIENLGPSMIDFEIKSLHPLGGGSYKLMIQFLKMIVVMFESNMHFELAQSYLALFLKSHGTTLTESADVVSYLNTVQSAQNERWTKLEKELLYGLGVVSALRNYAHAA